MRRDDAEIDKMLEMDRQIESLLDRAYESGDEEEIGALVDQVLTLEPDNPEALLLKADLTEDEEERLDILSNTAEAVRAALNEMEVEEEDFEADELGMVYLALRQRMAFTLLSLGDGEGALAAAEELLRHDLDDEGATRNLYYRILIERGDWSRIIEETLQDEDHQLGWAWARVAAAFMLRQDGNAETAARMFWEALAMGPNVPFYMLGYMDEPGEGSGEEEDFNFAILYEDVWNLSRDLLNWFSRGVLLFGLLSGRFDDPGEEGVGSEEILKILDSLGGREEYDRVAPLIRGDDDLEIIETLAAQRCLAK